jgi:hypothetical protein
MPYLIQAEDRPLTPDLLHRLAQVMAESPDLVLADATFRLTHGHGVLPVEDQKEAERLVARFTELGFPHFLVDALVAVPKAERLRLEHPAPEAAVELVAAARLDMLPEHTPPVAAAPLGIRLIPFRAPTLNENSPERILADNAVRYYLDLGTREKRWRAVHLSLVPIEDFLSKAGLPATALTAPAQALLTGNQDLPRFPREADYERYVTWLYQLRYAPR